MLTYTLRSLERDGLIKRVVHPIIPPQVEYSLTPLGETLIEPMWALRTWAYNHLLEVEQARIEYDQENHPLIQQETARKVQQR